MEKVEKDAVQFEGEANSQNPEEAVVWNGGGKKLPPGIFDIWDPLSFLSHPLRNLPSLNPTEVELEAVTAGQSWSNQNLCKFYDGVSDGCWKGDACKAQNIKKAGPTTSAEFYKLGPGVRKEEELDGGGVAASKINPEKLYTKPNGDSEEN